MEERKRSDLFDRHRYHVVGNRISSAVIVPVFEKDGEYHLLFIKRTKTLRHHKGQISFAGGTKELEEELDGAMITTCFYNGKIIWGATADREKWRLFRLAIPRSSIQSSICNRQLV